MKYGKSTDGLMRHIRDKHHINIEGSKEKQQLLNMGYYHGYKAARFVGKKDNSLDLTEFKEVSAIYDFDISIKTILYPCLIKIETSIKNRTIDYLVAGKNCEIEDVYKNVLVDYKEHSDDAKKYKKYLKKKLDFREKMDGTIAYHYSKNTTPISYYLHDAKPIPVWAYFEVMTLGELANFIDCMSLNSRIDLAKSIGVHHTGMDQNGRMIVNTLYTLTGLRNATMHNSMIFDCRFNNSNISNQVKQFYQNTTRIKNLEFKYLIDFLVIIIFLLKQISTPKTELKRIVRNFDSNRVFLFNALPFKAYSEIMGTDVQNKIKGLNEFIQE